MQKPLSLYFHIPFCKSRCPYCDFYSTTDLALREDYTRALVRAVEGCPAPPGTPVPTVYFGGGTPYLLGDGLLQVLEAVQGRFSLLEDCEITLEANPGDLEEEGLRRLREGGFCRLSLGLQAGEAEGLGLLGRRHTPEESAQGVALARKAGFSNLSVDLMLATPGQTVERAVALAEYGAGLAPEHISAYLLKIEPGTPFAKGGMEARCPGPDQAADIYLAVCRRLEELGYRHYEISNFAKPGYESRHNTVYWRLGEYLGFGPSAASSFQGRRFRVPGDLAAFLAAGDPWETVLEEGPSGGLTEYVMLSLRLAEGLELCRLPDYGGDPEEVLRRAAPLEGAGLLTIQKGHIALTQRGFLLSNAIIAKQLE